MSATCHCFHDSFQSALMSKVKVLNAEPSADWINEAQIEIATIAHVMTLMEHTAAADVCLHIEYGEAVIADIFSAMVTRRSLQAAAAIADHFDVERAASIFEAMQDEAMPISNKRTHNCVERSHIAHLVWKIFAVHVIGILNTPSYH